MNTMNHTTPRTAVRPQATTLRRAPLLLALCLIGFGLLALGAFCLSVDQRVERQ